MKIQLIGPKQIVSFVAIAYQQICDVFQLESFLDHVMTKEDAFIRNIYDHDEIKMSKRSQQLKITTLH